MKKTFLFWLLTLVVFVSIVLVSTNRADVPTVLPDTSKKEEIPYTKPKQNENAEVASVADLGNCGFESLPEPETIRAIYMSSWVAGTKSVREKLVKQIQATDLNAVVIDIKDVTGHVFIPLSTEREQLLALRTVDKRRVRDFGDFLQELCGLGIYPIARTVIFKDPLYAQAFPDQAVQYSSGDLWWGDGSHWVSPASVLYWEYMADLAQAATTLGFREINFDYIRYPSRGNLSAAVYPGQGERTRSEVMKELLRFFDQELRSSGTKISVDIFGMALSVADDVGIGQQFEDFFPFVDVIAPMVYPSHYYAGFAGVTNPNEHPYQVAKVSVGDGVKRLEAAGVEKTLLRPWLQDFSIDGVYYGSHQVQEQIRALEELGIDSWILWDPQNTYHY